jgi:predicted nuclease of predicted toxin-antitoxin system
MGQPVKFYADEHISRAIVRGLRQRGADVLTTTEAGLLSATDEEHLERALLEGRVLVTYDQDYHRLHASGISHAGIAIANRTRTIGDIIRGLMLIHQVLDADEMKNQVEYL